MLFPDIEKRRWMKVKYFFDSIKSGFRVDIYAKKNNVSILFSAILGLE